MIKFFFRLSHRRMGAAEHYDYGRDGRENRRCSG